MMDERISLGEDPWTAPGAGHRPVSGQERKFPPVGRGPVASPFVAPPRPAATNPFPSSACGCGGDAPANAGEEIACCGRPPSPTSVWERPGYRMCPYTEKFLPTPAGDVPTVATRLSWRDHLGTAAVRCAVQRDDYRVAPGLYAVGAPCPDAPVLVTANYKLSFDALRCVLTGRDAWILVVDTLGVNVWCAAGKGSFSTAEVVRRVRASGLERVVRHRRLVLPQLSATGVSARDVKRESGFEVVWGPVRSSDLPAFLDRDFTADEAMRRVTFSLAERAVLVPVELALLRRYLWWLLGILAAISLVVLPGASWADVLHRAWDALLATGLGIVAGAVLTPLLLPLVPGRAFSVKGFWTGLGAALCLTKFWVMDHGPATALALILWLTTVSSYLAMNFTGSTPFTSPSGVEREMRRAIPVQAGATVLAVLLWVGGGFFS